MKSNSFVSSLHCRRACVLACLAISVSASIPAAAQTSVAAPPSASQPSSRFIGKQLPLTTTVVHSGPPLTANAARATQDVNRMPSDEVKLPIGIQPVNPNEPGQIQNDIKGRQEWFLHNRAWPLDHVPAGARLKAFQQVEQMRRERDANFEVNPVGNVRGIAGPSMDVPGVWNLIGPQGTNVPSSAPAFAGYPVVAGRVTALAVDPTDPLTVYLGGAAGGLWRTSDGGTTWTPLTDVQASLSVGSITIDPSNHSTVYVGTGEDNFSGDSYYGAGILKTTDGGNTWSHYAGPFSGPSASCGACGGSRISSIAVDPGNSQILIAGVTTYGGGAALNGIFRSTDGGQTWTEVFQNGGDVNQVFFSPKDGTVAWAALGENNTNRGIWKSTDGGVTWNPSITNPSGFGPVGRVAMAIASSNPNYVYGSFAAEGGGSLLVFLYTKDGGTTWAKYNAPGGPPDYCQGQCWYDNALAVSPTNPAILYAVGSPAGIVIRSVNNGGTWDQVATGSNGVNVHTDGHAVAFSNDGATVFVGTDGGAWSGTVVTTGAMAWNELNSGLAITEFYNGMSIDPLDINETLAGAQDNDCQHYSGSILWTDLNLCGDGGWTAIDPTISQGTPDVYTSYVAAAGQGFPDVQKSTDGSRTFSYIGNGLPSQGTGTNFVPPFTIDNVTPSNIFYGTLGQVWESKDKGNTWAAISGDMTGGAGTIAVIKIAQHASEVGWTGTDNGYVWVNRGTYPNGLSATWTTAVKFPRPVTDILVPTSGNVAFVALGGFSGFGDTDGHIYRTTDYGATWTDITGKLPNLPINAVVWDQAYGGQLYVGTDMGVYAGTPNSGDAISGANFTWTLAGHGLPNVPVTSLVFDQRTRTLRAATHGRSIWDLSMAWPDTVNLTTSANPVPTGSPVTFTASMKQYSPDGTHYYSPAGNINFMDGSANLGTVALTTSSGSPSTTPAIASFTTSKLSPGTHNITAVFPQQGYFQGNPSNTITQAISATTSTITLTPASIAFPSTVDGVTSTAQVVTVKNTGTSAATLSSETLTGTNPTSFLISANTCTTSLAAGASCAVSVEFKPLAVGALTASLSVADSASGSPQLVTITGTGSAVPSSATLTPATITLPNQILNTTSATQTYTLKNTGSGALTITGITYNPGGVFAASTNCPTSAAAGTLAAGASCQTFLTFTPTAVGNFSGAITVTDNAGVQTATYFATGISSALTVAVSPAVLTFGSSNLGTTTAVQLVTVKNTGSSAVTLASETITGTNATSFLKSATTCGSSLAAGAGCTVSVAFKPLTAGALTASLAIADNGTGSPQTVSLSGTGVGATTLTLTPTKLVFPNTILGTTSDLQTVVLQNTGTAPVNLTSVLLGGNNGTSFQQLSNCGTTLAASASCTVYVAFAPISVAALTGTLTFTDNATGSPQIVALSGTGTPAPSVRLSVTSLTFPTTLHGTTSAPLSVTLTNSGAAVLDLASISLTGTNPTDFEALSTCPATLAPAASCNVYVGFRPAAAAAYSAKLSITDNGSASPQSVTLIGTGK